MRRIIGVDPGTTDSAFVTYHPVTRTVLEKRLLDNYVGLSFLHKWARTLSKERPELVIEGMSCQGQRVGRETFITCEWIGRFGQIYGGQYEKLERRAVLNHLCGKSTGGDAAVRAVLIDRFGPGKSTAVGKKASPGPLYGIKSHLWQALAVAVSWADLHPS